MRIFLVGTALFFGVIGCATPFSSWNATTFAPIRTSTLPPIDDQPARLLLHEKIVSFEEQDGAVVAREFVHTTTRIHNARGQDWRDPE